MQYRKKVIHTEQQEEHQCPICDKVFNTKHGLDCHSRSVHGQRKFVCEICSIKLKRKSNLDRHYKLVHEIDIKKCYQEDLELHFATSVILKPFIKKT